MSGAPATAVLRKALEDALGAYFGAPRRVLRDSAQPVRCCALSRDGALAACGGDDHQLVLYDTATGQAASRLALDDPVTCLAFHPSKPLLAYRSGERTVAVREPGAAGDLRTLTGHEAEVLAVAWSPDGALLATGGKDRTARLWDAVRGELLSPPLPHAQDIRRVLFGPGGTRALVVCAGDTVARWDITPDTRPADLLLRLAEVVSGARVDENQARQALGPPALRSAWEKLKPAR